MPLSYYPTVSSVFFFSTFPFSKDMTSGQKVTLQTRSVSLGPEISGILYLLSSGVFFFRIELLSLAFLHTYLVTNTFFRWKIKRSHNSIILFELFVEGIKLCVSPIYIPFCFFYANVNLEKLKILLIKIKLSQSYMYISIRKHFHQFINSLKKTFSYFIT